MGSIGEAPPVDLTGQMIYYMVGRRPSRDQAIGTSGPTSSARMDSYSPPLSARRSEGDDRHGPSPGAGEDRDKGNQELYCAAAEANDMYGGDLYEERKARCRQWSRRHPFDLCAVGPAATAIQVVCTAGESLPSQAAIHWRPTVGTRGIAASIAWTGKDYQQLLADRNPKEEPSPVTGA